MNSLDNQHPAGMGAGQPVPPASPAITPAMVEYLRQTKPWVRFLSVLGFIGIALLLLLSLAVMVSAGFMSSLTRSELGGAPMVLIGFVYLVLAVLYFFPVLYLHRFAGAIGRMLAVDHVAGMEEALGHQRSFWRFVGILMLVLLIVQVVVLLVVIVVALAAAGGMR